MAIFSNSKKGRKTSRIPSLLAGLFNISISLFFILLSKDILSLIDLIRTDVKFEFANMKSTGSDFQRGKTVMEEKLFGRERDNMVRRKQRFESL